MVRSGEGVCWGSVPGQRDHEGEGCSIYGVVKNEDFWRIRTSNELNEFIERIDIVRDIKLGDLLV